jgi:MFS family permease
MLVYSSKSLSYLLIALINFMAGVEYAIIIPSALEYLKLFNGGTVELALLVSAYSFSSLFASPFLGFITDRYLS